MHLVRLFVIGAFFLLIGAINVSWAADQEWKLLFTLQADKGGAALAQPMGLFVDGQAERYYVMDTGRNRLLSYGKDGGLLHAFNAGGVLEKPVAMVKKADGRLLVVEKGKGAVTEIDLKTKAVLPHRLEDRGRMLSPQQLKAGEQRFYLLDKGSGAIVVLDDKLAVSGRLSCPDCRMGYVDFALKGSTVYALPALGGEVHVFDGAGALNRKIALNPAPDFAVALAVTAGGDLLLLERHGGSVARYRSDGRLVGRALGPGNKGGRLSYPTALVVDPWGRVCIVDEGNGRVSIFQP